MDWLLSSLVSLPDSPWSSKNDLGACDGHCYWFTIGLFGYCHFDFDLAMGVNIVLFLHCTSASFCTRICIEPGRRQTLSPG